MIAFSNDPRAHRTTTTTNTNTRKEERGRAHRIRANHTQCLILQRHSGYHLHSPNKTRRTLPSRGTVHDSISFSAPSPGLVVVPVLIRWKSRTRGLKEKKGSIRPTKLVSCRTIPTASPFVSTVSLFPSTDTHPPFVSPHSGSPFASTGPLVRSSRGQNHVVVKMLTPEARTGKRRRWRLDGAADISPSTALPLKFKRDT